MELTHSVAKHMGEGWDLELGVIPSRPSLEVQGVQYLNHYYSSRPYLQSIQAMAGRYASEEYSSYSSLRLYFPTINCSSAKG